MQSSANDRYRFGRAIQAHERPTELVIDACKSVRQREDRALEFRCGLGVATLSDK